MNRGYSCIEDTNEGQVMLAPTTFREQQPVRTRIRGCPRVAALKETDHSQLMTRLLWIIFTDYII